MKQPPPPNPPQAKGLDHWGVQLLTAVVRRPLGVIAIILLAVLAIGSGARHLEFSNNYRVFFSPENPELITFENFQSTYTKNDNILFVVKPRPGTLFTPEVAGAVERLTEEAWTVPFTLRVDSIANFQHTWSQEDDLTVEDLIRDGALLNESELAQKRQIALEEPLLAGSLIARDGEATGINITLQYPEESLEEVPMAAARARELAAQLEQDFPGVEVALSGVSMLNNAFAESGKQDSMTLIPLMFLMLVALMMLVLRSWAGTLVTLSVVALSSMVALGTAGYVGIQLTPISVTAPVIIMTLAIADSVHILITMLGLMREGQTKAAALQESIRINFVAVLITSVTTLIGFLTLNFSDAPPFRDLGNITVFGIAAAWFLSVTFLPALLTVLPFKVKPSATSRGLLQGAMERLGAWVTHHHRQVIVGSGLISLALVAMVPLVDLNDQWVQYFDHRVEFRNDAEFAIENLGGIYPIEFSLEARGPEGISEPEYLKALDRFTAWLRTQPEVAHVYSYSDVIKRLNKNLHEDQEEWYRIPEDRALAAQYLLLYEISLPFGLDLNDRINVDKSSTRVTATIGDLSTRETRAFLSRSEEWLEANTPEYMWASPTGASVMFSYISQRNIESMLRGNLIAVLLIGVIMMLVLRSFRLGVVSFIPNAIPVLMTFGLWALLVGKVGMSAATVSASSLGIIVDDTVHMLTKYLRARREQGLDRAAAVRYAFKTVGVAILGTTMILSAGFLVLAFSTFRINFELGILTAIAIVFALLTDLFLLPSLLLWGYKKETSQEERHELQAA